MTDRYTKAVLTVIAVALCGLVVQNAVTPAAASGRRLRQPLAYSLLREDRGVSPATDDRPRARLEGRDAENGGWRPNIHDSWYSAGRSSGHDNEVQQPVTPRRQKTEYPLPHRIRNGIGRVVVAPFRWPVSLSPTRIVVSRRPLDGETVLFLTEPDVEDRKPLILNFAKELFPHGTRRAGLVLVPRRQSLAA